MKQVWKYDVQLADMFTIDIPRGSRILTVQVQNGAPRIWALVNPSEPRVHRRFRMAGTGHDIDDSDFTMAYIGSVQELGGALVWHLFEEV